MPKCQCENCGRTEDMTAIEQVQSQGHVAQLCMTCARYFMYNEQRLVKLVRGKSMEQSNQEMKKIHAMLSTLLMVGILLIVIVAGLAVAQHLPQPTDTFANSSLKQQTDMIAFYFSQHIK